MVSAIKDASGQIELWCLHSRPVSLCLDSNGKLPGLVTADEMVRICEIQSGQILYRMETRNDVPVSVALWGRWAFLPNPPFSHWCCWEFWCFSLKEWLNFILLKTANPFYVYCSVILADCAENDKIVGSHLSGRSLLLSESVNSILRKHVTLYCPALWFPYQLNSVFHKLDSVFTSSFLLGLILPIDITWFPADPQHGWYLTASALFWGPPKKLMNKNS